MRLRLHLEHGLADLVAEFRLRRPVGEILGAANTGRKQTQQLAFPRRQRGCTLIEDGLAMSIKHFLHGCFIEKLFTGGNFDEARASLKKVADGKGRWAPVAASSSAVKLGSRMPCWTVG